MLTLILAPPRTGKSQYVVSLLHAHKQDGKRVFVTNFKQTPEQREATGFELFADDGDSTRKEYVVGETGDPSTWYDDLPDGSVWCIDEAQEDIPQRDKHTQLPSWVKLFSKHGHKDLTVYIITQDAMQLDVHLRRNSNITQYMTRPLNMKRALIYTFRGYQEIPNDAWRRLQVLKSAESKKKFSYRKKWQEMYVSASAHDHIRIRLPWKLAIPVVGAFLVVFLLWWAINRLRSTAETSSGPVASAAAAVIGADAPTAAATGSNILTVDQYEQRFTPRVKDIPWSAPAYDSFEVTDYPRPYCYVGRRGCRCYTQQASLLDISHDMCLKYVENGYFDPFSRTANNQMQPAVTDEHARAIRHDRTLVDSLLGTTTSGSVGSVGMPNVDPTYGTITRP